MMCSGVLHRPDPCRPVVERMLDVTLYTAPT
jgi:hypothetical protein